MVLDVGKGRKTRKSQGLCNGRIEEGGEVRNSYEWGKEEVRMRLREE